MRQRDNEDNGYRCPQCQSHATQSICLAYRQAVRTGYSGDESVSRFAEDIAPPKYKDDTFVPSVVACATAVFAFWKLPDFLDGAGVDALTGLSSFSWPILALSCICGWICGAVIAVPAIRYNAFTVPPLMRDWEKGMICRRCSRRWQRDDMHDIGGASHDYHRVSSADQSFRTAASNPVKLVCGPTEFRWKSIIARVEYVLEYADRVCLVVLATGGDPGSPKDQDVMNARLTAVVLSQQIRFRFTRKRLAVYLKYPGNTQREIEVDIRTMTKLAKDHLANMRDRSKAYPLPTPLLGYLMLKHNF